MKSLLISFLVIVNFNFTWADTSTLLNQKGAELDFSSSLKQRKTLNLDDAFLIQLFSRWKAAGALKPQTNEFFNLMFSSELKIAFDKVDILSQSKVKELKEPVELYLLYKRGFFQTFISRWIDYSVENQSFLKSELALALDHVVSPQASLLLLESGYHVDEYTDNQLGKLENVDMKLNFSLQAYRYLRRGEKATQWIGKLDSDDILRLYLGRSAFLNYAKTGELGASGKLIKKVIEPWIAKTDNEHDIAQYYMSLARLLYQARAYKQANHFYSLIPEESEFFVEARVESLWASLQMRDFSKAKGDLATLELGFFNESFYPEIHLVSAIGHTMLCQFSDAKRAINRFISVNKSWARKIESNLKNKKAPIIDENFYVQGVRKQYGSLQAELSKLIELGHKNYKSMLQDKIVSAKIALNRESKRQWQNRKEILSQALYKMRFVRIELLSRMRAFREGMNNSLASGDEVHIYQAATTGTNEMEFPGDGMLWGDELFKMNAKVQNECVKGKYYDK